MKIEPKELAAHTEVLSDETVSMVVIYEWDPLYSLIKDLTARLSHHDEENDDDTAPYHQMQRISSQINRAQSGEGPFRARLVDIAEIAIATILSIDRNAS